MSENLNKTAADIQANRYRYVLIDVREPEELSGPEGFIKEAILAPLGLSLIHFLNVADPSKAYIFICRSGQRSSHACEIATSYGFQNVYNMEGGMVAWKRSISFEKTSSHLTNERINGTNKPSENENQI